MLQDDSFKNHNNVIIDECITFFLAGSQTVKASNANIIQYLTMHKPYHQKLMKELKETFFEDYLKSNPGKPVDIRECITYEKM